MSTAEAKPLRPEVTELFKSTRRDNKKLLIAVLTTTVVLTLLNITILVVTVITEENSLQTSTAQRSLLTSGIFPKIVKELETLHHDQLRIAHKLSTKEEPSLLGTLGSLFKVVSNGLTGVSNPVGVGAKILQAGGSFVPGSIDPESGAYRQRIGRDISGRKRKYDLSPWDLVNPEWFEEYRTTLERLAVVLLEELNRTSVNVTDRLGM